MKIINSYPSNVIFHLYQNTQQILILSSVLIKELYNGSLLYNHTGTINKIWESIVQWNLSNLTHQGTWKMCQIKQDVRILRLYLYFVFGTINFCRMSQVRLSENSGLRLHKFHCTIIQAL
jgi:hypothetical protein